VLEEQVRELVVDRRRIGIRREGVEVVAVPTEGLAIVRELLARILGALILGVIVGREVVQVDSGQHLRCLRV
jgi:hypothetical protein